jgi:hypothetical protein
MLLRLDGVTVRLAVLITPPQEAEMTTGVELDTPAVITETAALVVKLLMTVLGDTAAVVGSELLSEIV